MENQSFVSALIQQESARNRSPSEYFEYHRPRYEYLFRLATRVAPDRNAAVLDVGPSFLTLMLAGYYRSVVTLGFENIKTGVPANIPEGTTVGEPCGHIVFNLNDCQRTNGIETDQRFDLITFCEVIEHLYTAPEIVLNCLRMLLAPGGLIICQTPNAAKLAHRIKMPLGINPFERIRFNPMNPGHFREYTKRELIEIGRRAGLDAVEHHYCDYFGFFGGARKRLSIGVQRAIGSVFPSLRQGQTIVFAPTPSEFHTPRKTES